jgi:type II secretory pathway predicted ATPase ExeA/predicted  nucleic acid-binding Zn-ribbon protein
MYLRHYQLKLKPFEIGPDPKFLWLGEKHKEAFAVLKYGILENKGFTVLIGEPGTGKSTLLNAIAQTVGSNIRFAKISDPALNEMEFFNFVADAFEMGRSFSSKADFLIHLETFINEASARSQKILLVIDEAQRLAPEMLEQIRLFSNFEAPDKKVLSCIFAGQSEFLGMLKQNRALSQRIFFSHILHPLTEAETEAYIAHRLMVAGAEKPIFTAGALRAVHALAGGNPRLINIVCDQALLSGYSSGIQTIGPEIVRECSENTLIPRESGSEPPAAPKPRGAAGAVEARPGREAAAPDLDRSAPVPVPGGGRRKSPSWAPAALVVLMALSGYLYFTGALDGLLSGRRPSTGPDGAGRKTALAPSPADTVETGKAAPNAAEIAQLQKNLESAASNQAGLKSEMEAIKQENARLQSQLTEITNQKGAAEARAGDLQKLGEGLAGSEKELKSARERLAQLEASVAAENQKRIQFEKKLEELEKALTEEKGAKNQVSAELSSRQAAIADLQKRIDAARSAQSKLEADFQNTQQENARLQSQLREARSPKAPPSPAPAPAPPPEARQPQTAPAERPAEAPDPASIIDYVLKKKSQP